MLASSNPVAHVVDKPLITGKLFGMDLWLVSNVTIMLLLGATITALLVIPAARRIRTGHARTLDDFLAEGKLANFVEAICLYLRNDVFRPVLGDQTDTYSPMLWTLFWFILVCNLMGLIPLSDLTGLMGLNHGHGIGGTATQSIWVTGGLAAVAFLFWNGVAILKSPTAYLKHMTAGSPWFMWVIMIPVEIIGMFIKPFALAVRLFANMTGGHMVIAVFLSFIGPLVHAAGAKTGFVVLPILGAVAINLLEILVALIQAYIFMFLTCLFLSLLVVHEHEEHDESEASQNPDGRDEQAVPA